MWLSLWTVFSFVSGKVLIEKIKLLLGYLKIDQEHINYTGGTMEYKIQLLWDNEASVWVATSPDVPGLVLESGSFDALIERVRYAIPELLELNRQKAPLCHI